MNKKDKKIICLCGPTAVGKTAVALELVQEFPVEMINADSRQFYKELHIGTAKPTQEELQDVPCHLIDCASIEDPWSVGTFVKEANLCIERVFQHGKIPLIVGGTGMYVQALTKGLATIPAISESVRTTLKEELNQKGLPFLYQSLQTCDPLSASHLNENDKQRILRALEVFRQTGKSIRDFWQQDEGRHAYDNLTIVLNKDREVVYEKINARVNDMIKKGLRQEAFDLWQRFPHNELLSKTIGYSEWQQYGFDEEPLVIQKIQQNTRNFAKRQLTWFRKDKEVTWFSLDKGECLVDFMRNKLSLK
jgi:tRNA dimethylallyltransferase